MKIKIIACLFFSLASNISSADYQFYGSTEKALESLPLTSSIPSIKPHLRRVEFTHQDIYGALPFVRTYQSSKRLESEFSYSLRYSDLNSQDSYNIDVGSDFGSGWTHNYDYEVITNSDNSFSIKLPSAASATNYVVSAGRQITSTYDNKIRGSQYYADGNQSAYLSVHFGNTRLILKKADTFINGYTRQGSEVVPWVVSATIQPGGRVIGFAYDYTTDPDVSSRRRFYLRSISDLRGNTVTIERESFDGSLSGNNVEEGLIIGVSQYTKSNFSAVNQSANYEYDIVSENTVNYQFKSPVLKSVFSTVGTDRQYDYSLPMFVQNPNTSRVNYEPSAIISYGNQQNTLRNWSYGRTTIDNSSAGYIETWSEPDQSDLAKIEFSKLLKSEQSVGSQPIYQICNSSFLNADGEEYLNFARALLGEDGYQQFLILAKEEGIDYEAYLASNGGIPIPNSCRADTRGICPNATFPIRDTNHPHLSEQQYCQAGAPITTQILSELGTLHLYPPGSTQYEKVTMRSDNAGLRIESPLSFSTLAYSSGYLSYLYVDKVTGNQAITDKMRSLRTNIYFDGLDRVTRVSKNDLIGSRSKSTLYTYNVLADGSSNPYNSPTKVTSPNSVTENTLNTRGQILQSKVTSTLSGTSSLVNYTYEEDKTKPAFGEVVRYDGPRTDTDDSVDYEYNEFGEKVLTRTYHGPVGANQSYITQLAAYNSLGLPTVVIDANGNAEKSFYDSKLRLIKTERGLSSGQNFVANNGPNTQYQYDNLNFLKREIDTDGTSNFYFYDVLGRLTIKSMQSLNGQKLYAYKAGRLISISSGNGAFDELKFYNYNSSGQLLSELEGKTDPIVINKYEYNLNGAMINREYSTAVGVGIETIEYDGFGRVIGNTNAAGEQVSYGYDLANNLISQIYQNGTGSNFAYESNGVAKEESNTDYSLTTFEFDEAKNPVFKARAPVECQSTFSSLGELTTHDCVHTSSSNKYDTKGYDFNYQKPGSIGLLSSATPSRTWSKNGKTGYMGVKTDYEYDANYRVVKKTQHNGTAYESNLIEINQIVDYGYTPAGRISAITYPSGKVVEYLYGPFNKAKIGEVRVGGVKLLSQIAYTNTNKPFSMNMGNQAARTTWRYDPKGSVVEQRITGADGYLRESFKNWYYPNKQLKKQWSNGGTGMSYQYDILGQLTAESHHVAGYYYMQANYSYDSNGNRTNRSTSYSTSYPANNYSPNSNYTHTNNILTSVIRNGVNHTSSIDVDGVTNIPSIYGNANYDAFRNKRYSAGSDGATPLEYDYNHKNERTVQIGANQLRHFVYDESSHLIGEYDYLGNPIVEYVWLDDMPVAAMYPNNRIIYLITDTRNAPRRGIDLATDEVVWAWDPDAFGTAPPHIDTVEMNLRFPGQYYDQATGLHYNHNRYYAPDLGRYLEPDPIGLEGGRNPYSYVGNDPVNNVDPSGLVLTELDFQGLSGNSASIGLSATALNQMFNSANMMGVNTVVSQEWTNIQSELDNPVFSAGWCGNNTPCKFSTNEERKNATYGIMDNVANAGGVAAGAIACLSGGGCIVGLGIAAISLDNLQSNFRDTASFKEQALTKAYPTWGRSMNGPINILTGVGAGRLDTTPGFLTLPIYGNVTLYSAEIYKSVEYAPNPNQLLIKNGQ